MFKRKGFIVFLVAALLSIVLTSPASTFDLADSHEFGKPKAELDGVAVRICLPKNIEFLHSDEIGPTKKIVTTSSESPNAICLNFDTQLFLFAETLTLDFTATVDPYELLPNLGPYSQSEMLKLLGEKPSS